jgi:hypothetical protein
LCNPRPGLTKKLGEAPEAVENLASAPPRDRFSIGAASVLRATLRRNFVGEMESRGVGAEHVAMQHVSSTEPVDNPVERFPPPLPSGVSQRLFFLPLKF